MKFAADLESFLRAEVNINKSRLDALQSRVEAIESFVAGDDTFEPMFLDVIPAGSWAHRTIIKPVTANDEFDGDVLLYLKEEPEWDPRDYIENLYSAFRGSSTYKDKVSRMTRCVRVNYAGDMHVDVVPYLERYDKQYITNRHEPDGEGRFELSDPEGMTEWMDSRQRATAGTFVKVVRLVKYLRDYKNTFSCKSIILTTLLGETVNEIEASFSPGLYSDLPTALNTTLDRLALALPATIPAVLDPAGTGENFTDRWRDEWNYSNFRRRVVDYAGKVERAYDEKDRERSIELWQEILGDRFRPGSLAKVASLSPLSASLSWEREHFIDQAPFGYPIELSPPASVRISCRCTGATVAGVHRRNGFRQFTLARSGNRVAKRRNLRFAASVRGVTGPHRLFWKVRNGGQEAADANQLRGEISEDAGGHGKTETTSYKGTHYVECYVVQDGRVLARDRHTVIVT